MQPRVLHTERSSVRLPLPPSLAEVCVFTRPASTSANVRAEANLFIFSGVVLGLTSPSAAALALRSRWFVLRGGGGVSAAGKQTSKNICSPLLEDEQSQSYIYPERGDEKLFSYGRLNVPMLLPAFQRQARFGSGSNVIQLGCDKKFRRTTQLGLEFSAPSRRWKSVIMICLLERKCPESWGKSLFGG